MKTKTIAIVLFFIPLLLMGQNSSSFDLAIGLDYSYRALKAPIEEHLYSYGIELGIRRKLK